MNEHELMTELQRIGLNAQTFRAVMLLPLIEVAWADQAIQAKERKAILAIAKGHDLLEGNAADVVDAWLTRRPSSETFTLGRRLLATLAHNKTGLGADVPEHVSDTVVDLCSIIAESAGGLFGVWFNVSSEEKKTIRLITEHLEAVTESLAGPNRGIVGRTISHSWLGVLEDLGEDSLD